MKKMIHEHTLEELLLETDGFSIAWRNFKNWISHRTQGKSSKAAELERQNDVLVEKLKENHCWSQILAIGETYVGDWAEDFARCPWAKDHLERNPLRFCKLVRHVIAMDAANVMEFDQRIGHVFKGFKKIFEDRQGEFSEAAELAKLFGVATEISEATLNLAGQSTIAMFALRMLRQVIPRDIDAVELQLLSLFEGPVPDELDKSKERWTEGHIREWFHTYENYVLTELTKDPSAFPIEPEDYLREYINNDLKRIEKQKDQKDQRNKRRTNARGLNQMNSLEYQIANEA